MSVLG